MKYIVVLADGMAGEPIKELGEKTTMEAARKPYMDSMAGVSELGMAYMVPEGMSPGSDTANLSVLGYDPKVYYSGRSPLEALSIGVPMKSTDISFRCNLVTLSEEQEKYEEKVIIDHSSDEISTEDAKVLLEDLKKGLEREGYHFYAGTSYRHLLIWENGTLVDLTPPHDILGKKIGKYLPKDEVLLEMMKKSYQILLEHPINKERKAKGLNPANSAWFWGAGTRPALDSFEEKTGLKGAMISAVDLLKGIAVGAGLTNIVVPGANGGLDTNYKGKADAAVKALLCEGYDFVYIHVEAPDEMGHQGSVQKKIKAIENIDAQIIGRIREKLDKSAEEYRMLVLPDHPTPIAKRTHTKDPVPYLLFDSKKAVEGQKAYQENTANKTGTVWKDGYRLIEHLLSR